MVFNDTSTKDGLIQDCEYIVFGDTADTHISGNATRLAHFTRLINRAYDKAAGLILEADGRWQWDDTNYTDFPIGTTSLVADQSDYTLDVTHLKITRVEALTNEGTFKLLIPMDQRDINSESLTEFQGDSGTPIYYDKVGSSVVLYPAPSYASTNGLKVYFQRGPSYFDATDTVKTPGIPSIFHRYLSLAAAYDYASTNSMEKKAGLREEVLLMEESMRGFYSLRNKDENINLSARRASFK